MIPHQARRWRVLAASLFLVSTVLPVAAAPVAAAPTELFFSEYVEGSSNNKALEIYNGTGAPVDLTGGAYSVLMSFNGGTSTTSIGLAGTIASGDVFVLAHGAADPAILAQADQVSATTAGWFNGDDAILLRRGTTIVDAIGQVGFDPGTEWGSGLASTADNTLRRKAAIGQGDPDGGDAFDPAVQWDGFAVNTFDGLGAHTYAPPDADAAPSVTATDPVDGATAFPFDGNLSVTFSEPVGAAGAFTLSCTASGAVDLAVSGGPTTFTLNPAADLADGESCTLTVAAASVTDVDADDPPDAMAEDVTVRFTALNVCAQAFTPAYTIQGSGTSAAVTGTVTTQGVVVGDYEGPSPTLRGFYLQDAAGDADPATSDAIFVFNGNSNSVSLGQVVRVTGNAADFQDQTQVSASSITQCGTGTVSPVDVTLPVSSATFLERYEGMLVRLPQTLYVTEHFQLGRFGQVVMSAGDRLRQPTSVVSPGAPALAMQAANNLNRIIIDDAANGQNPDPIAFGRGGLPLSASNTLRGGDTATGTIGVMTYTWAGNSASGNAFRVRPVNALGGSISFTAANPRPTAAPEVGGSIRVAGLNLLNYFNTFDGASSSPPWACTAGVGGALLDCRGADDAGEFARQWPKTVAAILELDADVIGLNEIENDGYGPSSAIADLVDRLNAATAPGTYAFIDADAGTGQVNALGTDAIKVGMLYRPGAVTPVGQTATLATDAFVNGGDSGPRSRPSLAQAFEVNATGARFVVDANHLKSKGSACDAPDAGDGQGNCSAVRTNAAQALVDWLASDPTLTGDPDVLLVGDYNSYAMEDPIAAIEAGGFTNLVDDLLGDEAYSYVFDGQWAYLDYAFASQSLRSQVTGVADYHVNADEPSVLDYQDDFKSAGQLVSLYAPDEFRMSDHDPVVVGLALDPEPQSDRPNTGTGWILSPAGAYPAEPGATGKAQFAFDVKVSKQGVLGGSASLTFASGGFSFVATSFDRLVTSSTLATIRGTGTANGAAAYPFLLSAVDGSPDRLRLQVWTPGGAVAYDNGLLQPLGGGSIQVRPAR
ncbi:MAG: ExeM/NucH family extracellular endonuclease [Chloroflexota bacterium]